MGDIQFNVVKAKSGTYLDQVGTGNARLIAVLVKASGLEADATLKDHTTLASILAGTTDECDFTNYARKVISVVTNTVDNTNDWFNSDTADLIWATAGGATNNNIGAVIFCYDADTTSGTDSNIIPLYKMDYTETTTGSDLEVRINTNGLFRST